MYTVGGIAATFGAAALGSLVYLVQRQRPHHRPFGRRGWRYTIVAMAWVAAVTTVVVYLLTVLSSDVVPSPVLAFAVPIGAGGIRAVSQRGRGESVSPQSGESGPLPQLLALGLPLVLDWLDQHLADLKQQKIDDWHANVRTDRARRTMIRNFHARLAERSLPGTSRVMRRLHEREEIYTELYEQSLSCDAHAKRRLRLKRSTSLSTTFCDWCMKPVPMFWSRFVRQPLPRTRATHHNGHPCRRVAASMRSGVGPRSARAVERHQIDFATRAQACRDRAKRFESEVFVARQQL